MLHRAKISLLKIVLSVGCLFWLVYFGILEFYSNIFLLIYLICRCKNPESLHLIDCTDKFYFTFNKDEKIKYV